MANERLEQKAWHRGLRSKIMPSERRFLMFSRVILWVIILITLFPTLWVFMASLSKGQAFFLDSLFPKELSLDNYKRLFMKTGYFTWVKNSMILCTSVALIQIMQTALGAYAFSRMRFRGRKNGIMVLLLLQIFPSAMAVSAIYIMIYRFKLEDNLFALILLMCGGSAYNIWLLKGYIDKLPRDFDEAAIIDGAGHFQIFRSIIIPLALPMLVVIFLFTFIGTYSEFLITSVLARSSEKYTVAVGLRTYVSGRFSQNWTAFSAGAVVSSIPIMIVFMLLQKYIQGGLSAGGLKS